MFRLFACVTTPILANGAFAQAPTPKPAANIETFADVAYGPHERNNLDLSVPKSENRKTTEDFLDKYHKNCPRATELRNSRVSARHASGRMVS